MRKRLTVLGWIVFGVGVTAALVPTAAGATPDAPRVHAALSGLRLPLVANQGQVDARVAFYAPTFAGTLFVTRDGELVYALSAATGAARGKPVAPGDGWTLSERFAGGRAVPVGQDPSPIGVSYFVGNDPARWRPRVPAYDQLGLGEVWPGVAVSLRARGRSIEKIFTVQPGAPVDRIRMRVGGATGLAVDGEGALVARTGLGPVTFTAPIAYQEHDGIRRTVAVAYRLDGDEYGFTVGGYDRSRPLVIDPILQSTFVGGGSGDDVGGMAVHPTTGDVYVGGLTESTNFPHTLGGVRENHGGAAYDGYVARLNSTLTAFTQATYLGGSALDYVNALAISPTNGEIYVTGYTASGNFPGAGGGAQPELGGGSDAWVARLSPSLTTLPQATYLGGTAGDSGYGITIHPVTGDVYVTGTTDSADFPKILGGAQTTLGAEGDAYIARLNSSLTTILQSTFFGGNDRELGEGLAVHPETGDVYLTGYTASTNLAATGGAAQPTHGGGDLDMFVARLTGPLTALLKVTYLGTSGFDSGAKIAIHPMTGDVYVIGRTDSASFPGTAGGAQPNFGGGEYDAVVARFNSALTWLMQSTYFGGAADDYAFAIAIHPVTGEVYVAGRTASAAPLTGAAQPTPGGGVDAYVARLTAALNFVPQATYLGAGNSDDALALAFHVATGDVYVAGRTSSADFPAVAGGGQSTYGGSGDAFVSRLTPGLGAAQGLIVSALSNQPAFAVGQTLQLSMGLINPGLPATAAVFLGIIRPDGLIEFITGGGSVVGTLANLAPLVSGVPLSTPFAVPLPNLITRQWTGSEPRGTYVFVVVVYGGGQVLGVATAAYAFP